MTDLADALGLPSYVNCARFLGRCAREYQASVMRNRLRGPADSIRGNVMSHGWHERPVIGPVLWINRHVLWPP